MNKFEQAIERAPKVLPVYISGMVLDMLYEDEPCNNPDRLADEILSMPPLIEINENTKYEYRPMKRFRQPDPNTGLYYDEDWSEWQVISTYTGKGKPYSTISGAKGVVTSEKRSDARSRYNQDRKFEYEYKVQRRPISAAWEDV